MGQDSKIEWCHHTANLWWGCTEVHAGCDNCYARVFSNRYNEPLWGNDKPRKAIHGVWKNLDKFQRLAKKANEIHSVFVGSMMDIFEKSMPLLNPLGHYTDTDDLRQEFFTRITWDDGNLYPNLLFLLLTKRPSNIPKYVPAGWLDTPPKNVMYGTSPVDQGTAYKLVNQLLKVNGKKFLSVEPQLGSISLLHWLPKIDWVIQGGESGHHKRPFNTDWAREIKYECEITGVPYFFKQIDKIQSIPEDLQIRQFPI